MAKRKVGPSAIRKSVSLLKMLLDAGVSYRLIGSNGARGYFLGRCVSAKRQRPLVMIPADKVEQMRLGLLARRRGGHRVTAVEHNLRTVHTWCMSQIRCGWDLLPLAERAGSSAETIATSYLSQPTLTRDLGISEGVESFEALVASMRAEIDGGASRASTA